MSQKQYLTAFIHNSASIRDVVGEDITDAPHKAVAYNEDGKLVLPAADGDQAVGVVLSDAAGYDTGAALVTKAGMELDVLIKDIGLVEAGEAIAKGDLLTASAAGLPSNLVQAAFGAAASTLLALALRRSSYAQKHFPSL